MPDLTEAVLRVIHVLIQVFVIFPYSSLTIARQRQLPSPEERAQMRARRGRCQDGRPLEGQGVGEGGQDWEVSERMVQLCTSEESVSSLLAENPNWTPGQAWKALYARENRREATEETMPNERQHGDGRPEGEIGLERALKCGQWGNKRPSDLFLKMYRDALRAVENDVESAVVSPSLMGTCGTVPLTVISTIPDIARHMANIIVRAEQEVILATNYWSNGVAAQFLTNAIKELSRRAASRGVTVVVKIIYDRGSAKQLVEPHYLVPERSYTGKAVGLPPADEIPNVDLQVMNYHVMMLGTFHSKFMVVDRQIAILQSNNVQDNDNLEMMVHLEGPVVDAVYDMALVSWHRQLEPPMPSAKSPARGKSDEGSNIGSGSFADGSSWEGMFTPEGMLKGCEAVVHPGWISYDRAYGRPESRTVVIGADGQEGGELARPTTTWDATHPIANKAEHHLETNGHSSSKGKAITNGAAPSKVSAADRSTEAYLQQGDQALPESQIRDPAPASSLPEHNPSEPHYDTDIASEVARIQASVTPTATQSRIRRVNAHLNHTTNVDFLGSLAPECAPTEVMTPYIPHPAHNPVPMVLVNRPPHGPPTHSAKSLAAPQNEAWLSALRNAKKNIFIQSPTLNAEPLVPAIVEACERGVEVFCYICLGYNDAGELLPMQGGHNEMIAAHLHTALAHSPTALSKLHYFWYVAKDQTRPIPQVQRRRSCHIKLLIADEHVAIVGSGNQDTQSWYHSQEVNVMLDSPDVCRAWIDALRRNQNTHIYGAVDARDGVWRDEEGKEVPGAVGVDPGRFSWARGLVGALQRFRGVGGFG